jgi:Lrp/AsnC family transcriptional regulator, leucine-responsive regulatory protein
VDSKLVLDDTNRAILDILQQDARIGYAELGRRVGLSPPAVADRVRRLEDQGIIIGYRAEVDRQRLGYPLTAFIRLRTTSDLYPRLRGALEELPEVLECHHLTGEDALLLKAACRSIKHLDDILVRISPFGATISSIVLSSFVERKQLPPA